MIVPMKKAMLIAMKADKDPLLLALQRCGEFMVISDDTGPAPGVEMSEADLKAQQSQAMLKFLHQYQGKSSFFEDRPSVDYNEFLQANPQGEALAQELNSKANELSELRAEISTLSNHNEQLRPWLPMDLPVEALKGTKTVSFYTGFVPLAVYETVAEKVTEAGADVIPLDITHDGRAMIIAVFRSDGIAFMEDIKTLGYMDGAPPHVIGLPKDVFASNSKRIAACEEEITHIEETVTKLSDQKEKLALLTEQYDAQMAREKVQYSQTLETVVLKAWVRSDRLDVVKETVFGVTDVFSLEFQDPEEGEQPPTVTKNNAFFSQFETITDMFSKPKPGTLDPAPVAGLWYWIIFGMMMGDVGYGVCMAVLFYAFKKIKKPKGEFAKLINILLYSSIPTIFFGVLFGSYFGETWNPILFAPLDSPINMLIVTLVVGVLHIFSGMTIEIVEKVRSGHLLDAIFDQVSWMVLITGLGFLFLPALKTAGMVMAIGGAAVVLLTAGRDKPNIVGKITGGLLGLYDISSYMSDILSYSRILALSLATGVIGMVMNLLAGMVSGSIIGFVFAILIYLVGHSFNLAMSLLSAYVHDSRLQYIEFFNKFYEGGGYAFKPLSVQSKHIDVIDDENLN